MKKKGNSYIYNLEAHHACTISCNNAYVEDSFTNIIFDSFFIMISSQCVKTTTLCYVVTVLGLVFLLSCVLSKLKAADAAVYCANLLCHTYLVTGELHCQCRPLHCALGFSPKTDLHCYQKNQFS